ncbi:MAG: DNA-3-methyladenine glycosylase [Gammaproteobacteria bacterium]|nr:DNA-3-methyladenine glycosylase [Gammaproteobacteria bacterium]
MAETKHQNVPLRFFDQEPLDLARALLGKVLRHRYTHPELGSIWLSALIIETEAYEMAEKGSHASQGFTQKRAALFMPPGTIYMYYARGRDSLNFSAKGTGNGILIKSGYPIVDATSPLSSLKVMQSLNPSRSGIRPRHRLCKGQTLLCQSLNLKVKEWDQRLPVDAFKLSDTGYRVKRIIQCRRLGIPAGRDEHLPYRFIDYDYAEHCTSNPLTRRHWKINQDYRIIEPGQPPTPVVRQ